MTPDQADVSAAGDPLVLAIIACVLTLLCVLWATGVFAAIARRHRAGLDRVRNDNGRPLRGPLWLSLRQHDDAATDDEGNRW